MKSLSSDYGELPQLQTGKGKTNGKHKADRGKGREKWWLHFNARENFIHSNKQNTRKRKEDILKLERNGNHTKRNTEKETLGVKSHLFPSIFMAAQRRHIGGTEGEV